MTNTFFPLESIRPVQQRIIDKVNQNLDKRYFIIEAGTGIGKSPLAVQACLSDISGFIITDSLQLQEQYEKDFGNLLVNMKGRANYSCSLNKKFSCELGPCCADRKILENCIKDGKCDYYLTRQKALKSSVFLSNYAFFILASNCAEWLEKRNSIIFDEAHLLEKHLISFCTLDISTEQLDKEYEIIKYAYASEKKILLDSLQEANAHEYLSCLFRVIERKWHKDKSNLINIMKNFNVTNDKLLESILIEGQGKFYKFDKLYKSLQQYDNCTGEEKKDNWLIEIKCDKKTGKTYLSLRPLKVDFLFKSLIEPKAQNHIYFMSATILDFHNFCETLGIDENKACFIKEESPFDPDKSPIYNVCNCQTSYGALQDKDNLNKICSTINSILMIYPTCKGIIHTGNMQISRYIRDNLKSDRLLVRLDDISNRSIYEEHLKSKEPTVLVSSSMAEGVDLKDDLSRFQIIVKMPFESLADTRVKKLTEMSPTWYQVEMFRKLIQECGRSTRNETDYCDTYILDVSFLKWLSIAEKKNWLSCQFLKRIRNID